MKHTARVAAYYAATPFLWLAVFAFWLCLSLVLLSDFVFRWIFWFNTDPDPPGVEESDPSEGRFSFS